MAQTTYTDADVIAEVTDEEIEALQRDRAAKLREIANLREKLERAESELFTVESGIAEWIADVRAEFGFEKAPDRQPIDEVTYAAGYSYAAGYHD